MTQVMIPTSSEESATMNHNPPPPAVTWDPPAPPPVTWDPPAPPPPPTPAKTNQQHYDVQVNKGSLNVTWFTAVLNERWRNGWALDHIIEQRGNTVIVFAHRD